MTLRVLCMVGSEIENGERVGDVLLWSWMVEGRTTKTAAGLDNILNVASREVAFGRRPGWIYV